MLYTIDFASRKILSRTDDVTHPRRGWRDLPYSWSFGLETPADDKVNVESGGSIESVIVGEGMLIVCGYLSRLLLLVGCPSTQVYSRILLLSSFLSFFLKAEQTERFDAQLAGKRTSV